jgi:predicted ATPase/Tfp pilus assembly protein PilF
LLLVYLALEGPQNRRHLAELFWPDAADPMKSLTVALTRLRQGAPNVVDADNAKAWATVETDAQEMVELLEQGKLDAALALYKGPFLEGFYLPDWSAELEEWVYKTREFLAGQVREALLGLAERAAREGQFATSAKHAEAAYSLPGAATPEPEDLPRFYTFMLAGGSSQIAQVRQEAHSYGLKLTLSAEESRKQWQQTPELSKTPVYSKLPSRATAFVGRDLELTEIASLLSEQDCQLLTLVGPPGVGKTRLALQLARDQAKLGLFKDGVYYVALEALSTETLFPSILATLEIDAKGSEGPLEKIIRYIGEKNVLLVFDNFEHLIESASFVAELIKVCPNLKLLITSRERLNLESEQIFSVGGLPFPNEDVTLEEAQNFDAVSLFVQRARRARPDFALDEENLLHVMKLCRFVGGLPLALELAAPWIRVMTCEEMVEELEHNVDLFSTTTRDVPERHKSIRVAFEKCSWVLLTPQEQEAFRKLSVFKGGFRREAASEVAGATIPMLASLVDKSLLRVAPDGRYDFHPLLYQFTSEKLTTHLDEKKEVEVKHGEYFVRLMEQQGKELRGRKAKEALNIIDEELENLRMALAWIMVGKRLNELHQMLDPLSLFFDKSNRSQEESILFTQILLELNEANPDHHPIIGVILVSLAWSHFRLGSYEKAEGFARRGLELLRSSSNYRKRVSGFSILSQIAYRKGHYEETREHREKALELARQARDPYLISNQLGQLGMAEQQAGNYEQAVQYLHEALSLNRENSNSYLCVSHLINLGIVYREMEQHLPKVKGCYQEALELAREMDYREILPYCLSAVGETAREEKNYKEAQILLEEALQIVREGGEKFKEAEILTSLGKVAVALHHVPRAYSYFGRALSLAKTIESTPMQLSALIVFAELQLAQHQPESAARLLSFVTHHPATTQGEKNESRELLGTLQDQLAPKVMEEAMEHGKTMKLEEVVAEFIGQDSSHSLHIG